MDYEIPLKAPASEMIFSWDRNTEVPPEEQNHFEALIKKQHEEVRLKCEIC